MSNKLNAKERVSEGFILTLYNAGWTRDDISYITGVSHNRVGRIIMQVIDKTEHKANNKVRNLRAKELEKTKEFKEASGGYFLYKNKLFRRTGHNYQLLGAIERYTSSSSDEEYLGDFFGELYSGNSEGG